MVVKTKPNTLEFGIDKVLNWGDRQSIIPYRVVALLYEFHGARINRREPARGRREPRRETQTQNPVEDTDPKYKV